MSAIERAIIVVGNQYVLARAIGVTQPLVSQWVHGRTGIAPRHFLPIHKATRGLVRPEHLLADEIAKQKPTAAKKRTKRRPKK